ncbi:MAG TPA: hypothetical protein VKY36_02720 [Moheibacter sp.]|nr:hypothetical protein [Moheibacter sp.]
MISRPLQFPLQFHFHISTLHSDFSISEANGNLLYYVRQKMFRLKEKVEVFSDKNRTSKQFTIQANKWLDFNTTYEFINNQNQVEGRISRKGWRSLWKSHYEIFNSLGQQEFLITEKNPWTKIVDSAVGEIPVLGFFTGYILNPSYIVKNQNGEIVAELAKNPSFFGRKFTLHKKGEIPVDQQEELLLGLFMMVLLERSRG